MKILGAWLVTCPRSAPRQVARFFLHARAPERRTCVRGSVEQVNAMSCQRNMPLKADKWPCLKEATQSFARDVGGYDGRLRPRLRHFSVSIKRLNLVALQRVDNQMKEAQTGWRPGNFRVMVRQRLPAKPSRAVCGLWIVRESLRPDFEAIMDFEEPEVRSSRLFELCGGRT